MPTLNLSPTVRSILVVVGVILGAVVPVLVTAGVPVIVTAVAGAVVTALVGLGIVPPQTGGTQVGVVTPAVAVPPPAEVTVKPLDVADPIA